MTFLVVLAILLAVLPLLALVVGVIAMDEKKQMRRDRQREEARTHTDTRANRRMQTSVRTRALQETRERDLVQPQTMQQPQEPVHETQQHSSVASTRSTPEPPASRSGRRRQRAGDIVYQAATPETEMIDPSLIRRVRKEFIQKCGSRRRGVVERDARSQHQKVSEVLVRDRGKLISVIRRLEALRAEEKRTAVDDVEIARLGSVYDSMVQHPDVASLSIDGARLRICTKQLSVERDGLSVELGTFHVDIDVNAGTVAITDERTAKPVKGNAIIDRASIDLVAGHNYMGLLTMCLRHIRASPTNN